VNSQNFVEITSYLISMIDYENLNYISDVIFKLRNGRIFLIGNGGSAYSASHFAQDLVKACGISAESLVDNIGLVTAISNDDDYSYVFSKQLDIKYRDGDLLIAISCSGSSKNILEACKGRKVISFTSGNGGELKKLSLNVNVPTKDIYIAEGIHSLLLHYIIENLQERKAHAVPN